MRTYIYIDDRLQVVQVEGLNPHHGRAEFRFDGTRVTIANFEHGRCLYIAPQYPNFSELVKLYHQYEYPDGHDDEFYRMVVDDENGRQRYWIRYREVEDTFAIRVIEYYNDNVASGQELLLQADTYGLIQHVRPSEPLWLVQYLVSHARKWFNV